MTTLLYRRRAAEYLRTSQETDDPKARSELLTMAIAWAELAQWAESGNQTTTASPRHRTRPDAGQLEGLFNGVGVGLRTQYSDVLRGEIPDRIAELLGRLDQPTGANPA
jgi:hypothetical protein